MVKIEFSLLNFILFVFIRTHFIISPFFEYGWNSNPSTDRHQPQPPLSLSAIQHDCLRRMEALQVSHIRSPIHKW